MATRGIQWTWSIHRDGYRRATDVSLGVTLLVTNQRTAGGYGPFRWAAFTAAGEIARGEVWQGTRYSALVRQAMLDAELAAEAAVCDDCGLVGRHNYAIEH